MRKLIANGWMTLDGVVQAPGQADEESVAASDTAAGICSTSTISLGRRSSRAMQRRAASCSGARTYELLASYRPNASEEEQVIARPLNALPKYVASRTLSEPPGWSGAELLGDDIPKAVADLSVA